jgi:hypothetical protein
MTQDTGRQGGTPHAANPDAEAKQSTCSAEPVTRVFDPPPPAVAMPELFGRYRIRCVLGEGGMGTVYLAHDTDLDREVALKVPRFAPDEGAAAVERFLVSARAAATLAHPNLCPVYEAGQQFGIPYLTMPYIEGRPLAALLREGPLPPERALALVHKLALALQAAHQKGIVHRDLNPTNVLLTADGEPVVMDFGLARREGSARLTRAGQVLGTPGYVAPEQLSGDPEAQGPGCDVYSLGAILYELLTGEPPFGRTTPEVLLQAMTRDLVPPSARRPGLPPALDAVCAKALARDPRDRYRSMGELADAVRAIREAGPAAAPETVAAAPVRAASRPTAGRRWAALAAAAALLLILLAVGAWWLVGALPPASLPPGAVLLEIDQPGAAVFVDGWPWTGPLPGDGEPLRIELPEGPHELKVTRAGFEPYTGKITSRPGQTERLRAVLEPQVPATQRFEAEILEVAGLGHCTIYAQDMTPWRPRSWSQGKQLFVNSHGQRSCWVEWRFPVKRDGNYHLDLLATQAPDFGKLQASLDGDSLPEVIDTYGAVVQPMKSRRLGTFRLTAGQHRLRLTVVGRNEASSNTCFGIDAFDLTLARQEGERGASAP